jgi:hypothetical protein
MGSWAPDVVTRSSQQAERAANVTSVGAGASHDKATLGYHVGAGGGLA